MLRTIVDSKSKFSRGYIKVAFVIILLMLIGLTVIDRYGFSFDETAPIRVAFENAQIVKTGKPYLGHLKYYGTLVNVGSETIFQIQQKVTRRIWGQQSQMHPYEFTDRGAVIPQLYERLKLKHILIFLLSLVAYIAVAGLVQILAGLDYAWLGSVTLALFPNFWGHSFFNPKDTPLAVLFTLGTLLGACLVGHFLKVQQSNIKVGQTMLYSLGYGVVVGLVAGTRIDGSILLVFVAIAHLVASLGTHNLWREICRFWIFYGVMMFAWMVTTISLYPSAWFNPVGWFWETLQFYYNEDWPLTVLFRGQFISAEALPWDYLPRWFLITIPESFQLTFWAGLIWIGIRYRQLTDRQRVCIILVLLQIFCLPTIAIALQSTKYDGMRQFLYMIPGIAVICATAIAWLAQQISKKLIRLLMAGIAIALLSAIIVDMITLHPYEYLYFNRTFGGLAGAQDQYETDYWALSMREGMEWINNHGDLTTKVVSSEPVHASAAFAAPQIEVISYKEFEQTGWSKPLYYIAAPRWDFQAKFPECDVVHQVRRQGVPLTIVKQCN
jgi:hypothetical protein